MATRGGGRFGQSALLVRVSTTGSFAAAAEQSHVDDDEADAIALRESCFTPFH